MIKRFSLSSAIIIVALALGGCGGKKEEKSIKSNARSTYELAFQKYQKGYYNEAVAMYKRALEIDPDLSKAHLELGMIYDDFLRDKDKAIYHYGMYLRLEPSAEKAGMVREWIEKARGEASVASSSEPMPTAEVVRGEVADYGDAPERIKGLELENKAYLATIDELRKEVKRLTALQAGDIEAGTMLARGNSSLERKYEKEKIELLKKFEREKDKLRSQIERSSARISVLEAKVRSYKSKKKKPEKKKVAPPLIRRVQKKRVPTPAKKPAQKEKRPGVVIPSL